MQNYTPSSFEQIFQQSLHSMFKSVSFSFVQFVHASNVSGCGYFQLADVGQVMQTHLHTKSCILYIHK